MGLNTTTDTNSASIKKSRRKKRVRYKSRMITGYIIYASEIRKEVIKKYPNRDFGDISKLVGIEWKQLPQETKVAYEKRAQEQNAKNKASAAELLTSYNDSQETKVAYEKRTQEQNAKNKDSAAELLTRYNDSQEGSSDRELIASTPLQSMRTNIVYRKPATVRLRPKDASTQTESIKWVKSECKKPLKFSQRFLEHLNSHNNLSRL